MSYFDNLLRSTYNEWLRSRPYYYGSDVRTMLQIGLEITVVEYINAHKWRQEIKNAFLKAMADYDALLVPTTIL